MRLLFCSDFQLGAGTDYGTPQRPRLADQAETLDAITTLVATHDVTDVVFCGDAFQHRKPNVDELYTFGRWTASLPAPPLMLAGNHDVRGPGMRTVLELFGSAADVIERTVYARPGLRHLRALDDLPDVVLGLLPWTHPGSLRASRGAPSPAEHAAALVALAATLRAQADREAPESVPILVTHYALDGFSLPSGASVRDLMSEPVLDTNALAAQGWAYVFAGHVHRPDVLTLPGGRYAVSVGSPHVCDFGEADDAHGAWVLDVPSCALEHVPIHGRPFVTLESDLADIPAVGVALLDPGDVRDAVVRVRLRADEQTAARFDVEQLRRDLYANGAHKVYSVHLDVQRAARARAEVLTDTEPLKALDAWLSAAAADESLREGQGLRDYTARLLEEERHA